MKKNFGILILFTQLSCSSLSQDEIEFKIQLKPSLIYNQTLIQSSHSEITYKGTEEFLNILKEKGKSNPTITDEQQEMGIVFKTGKLINSGKFPLTMEFIKTVNSNGQKNIPDGTKIYGQDSIGKMPIIDSISSSQLSQDYKNAARQATQSIFAQMSFPEKKLKLGEQFTRESPLSIPVGGVPIDMTITTIYKLTSISNDTANFDILQTYGMKSDAKGIKASGEGKGKLIYDIKNNFYLRYQINTNLTSQLAENNCEMETKSNISYVQETTITTE